MPQISFSSSLCPDPLQELTSPPMPPSWIKRRYFSKGKGWEGRITWVCPLHIMSGYSTDVQSDRKKILLM